MTSAFDFHVRFGDGIEQFGVALDLAAEMGAATIIRAITI